MVENFVSASPGFGSRTEPPAFINFLKGDNSGQSTTGHSLGALGHFGLMTHTISLLGVIVEYFTLNFCFSQIRWNLKGKGSNIALR